MKEVEQNNINTVLDKIKEDCKAKVKLEADKYDYKDSPEFKKYAEKAKGFGWNIEDPAEVKILHAMYTIASSDPTFVEYGDPTKVDGNLSKANWIAGCVTTIDTLSYGIEEQFPKEVGFLNSVQNIMEDYGKKEQQEIENRKQAEKDRIAREKREKLKADKLKEEERLAKMDPKERTIEELKALLNKDMSAFVKKIFNIQMDAKDDSMELDAADFIVRNLSKEQSQKLRFEMLSYTASQSTRLVDSLPLFVQEYGDQFSAFENKDELMMDAHILYSDQLSLKAYSHFTERLPLKYRESDVTYQAREMKNINEEDAANFLKVQSTTDARLKAHGITLDTSTANFKMTISEESLKKALESKKKNENVKTAETAYDKMEGFRKLLIAELEDFRGQLMYTQSDPDANFTGTKTEGSKEYRAMTTALKQAINDLKDPNKSPADITASLDNVQQKSFKYWEEKIGITGGPHTDNGKLRFGIAADMRDRVNHYKKQYTKLSEAASTAFTEVLPMKFGTNFTLRDFAAAKQEIVNKGNKYFVKNAADYGDNYAKSLMLNTDKDFLKVRLKEKNSFDIPDYKNYNPHELNANAAKLAKNYLTKKYLKMLDDPKLTSEQVKDHTALIMSDAFDKQAQTISENSIFKDLVKKKPNDWFGEWEKIVKKVEELGNSRDESLFNIKRKYKSAEEYILYHNEKVENDLDEKAIQSKNTINSNLADVIVKSMLSDPKYDALRYTIAMKPEKEAELLSVVKDYIKDKKPLGSGEVTNKDNTLKKITSAIKSSGIKSDIMKKFAEREKRLTKESKTKTVNKNKNIEKNTNMKK